MASRAKPTEVTAPAIPADEAFANVIAAERDAAFMDAQALETQKVAREGRFNRDLARLDAAFKADMASLDGQIATLRRKIVAADVALESLKGEPSNVASMAAE
mgnify:CR=1 FL=1|jgi:hypothetical protein